MLRNILFSILFFIGASGSIAFGDEVYGGIGISIAKSKAGFVVEEVFPATPAEKGGIIPGDLVIAVDGQTTKDMSLDKVSSLIRGPVGSKVNLQLQNKDGIRTVELVRERIVLEDVCFLTGYYNFSGTGPSPMSLYGRIGNESVNLRVFSNTVTGYIKGEYVNLNVRGSESFQTLSGWIHGRYVSFSGSNWRFSGWLTCIPK